MIHLSSFCEISNFGIFPLDFTGTGLYDESLEVLYTDNCFDRQKKKTEIPKDKYIERFVVCFCSLHFCM